MIAQVQVIQITQATVIAILVSSTVVVVALIALIGYFASKTPEKEGGPLHFGNFFVVSLGIVTALIGFLIAFPLIVSGVFADPTQVIVLMSALFGTIVGLVGTYFGVKSSSDASQKAQELAQSFTPSHSGPQDGPSGEKSSRMPSETSNGTPKETPIEVVAQAPPANSEEAINRKSSEESSREDGED